MRRLLCAVIALMMLISAFAFAEETTDQATHNYILIIDNSRSTTGRHSLGGATDPKGLRFDAARLLYDNVVSSAEAGLTGKLGVIVFCGPENCVRYGPMDINADPEALAQTVGSGLSEATNRDHRDNYTDIRTAVENARDMMASFSGPTSVILLTDGVNDLTNVSDPFSQPENIEANDQTVAVIKDIRHRGADFHIIALTAQDSVRRAEDFMAFINRMAAAGGGTAADDGSFTNVLMATQSDLNSKLLQLLIKAEGTSNDNIQTSEQRANEKWPFTVPYSGISDATVNITFMPEDKEKIDVIALIDPDGTIHTAYRDGVALTDSGISVTDERSYVMLDIPAPQPGEWQLDVTGSEHLTINTVVRFNHNLKIRAEMPVELHAGETGTVNVFLSRYNGDHYEDIGESGIYGLSKATLTVLSPGVDSYPEEISLKGSGDRFTGEVRVDAEGVWLAEVSVKNDYWGDRVNDLSFEVAAKPVSEAAAQLQSALNAIGKDTDSVTFIDDNTMIAKTEQDGESFFWQVTTDPVTNKVSVSWPGNGMDDATAELRAEGSDVPLITGIHSGDTLDLSELGVEQEYGLLITAFSDPDAEKSENAPLPMQKLDLRVIPDVDDVGGAVLSVIDAAAKLAPVAANTSEEDIHKAVETVREMQESVESASQTVNIGETFDPAPPADRGLDASVEMASPDVSPEEAMKDAAASVKALQENIDNFAKAATDALNDKDKGAANPAGTAAADSGAPDAQGSTIGTGKAIGARGAAVSSSTNYGEANPNVESGTAARSTESNGDDGAVQASEPETSAANGTPSTIVDTLKQNWFILLFGAAGLVLLAILVLVLRGKNGEHINGRFKVECEAIGLEMLLLFDNSKRVKVNSPLTKHPDIAKLKRGKIYDVLSHIQIGTVKADSNGMVEGCELPFIPNEKLISLSCTNPRTSQTQTVYIGRVDMVESVLNVYDAGRIFDVTFNGNLSMDELLSLQGRR